MIDRRIAARLIPLLLVVLAVACTAGAKGEQIQVARGDASSEVAIATLTPLPKSQTALASPPRTQGRPTSTPEVSSQALEPQAAIQGDSSSTLQNEPLATEQQVVEEPTPTPTTPEDDNDEADDGPSTASEDEDEGTEDDAEPTEEPTEDDPTEEPTETPTPTEEPEQDEEDENQDEEDDVDASTFEVAMVESHNEARAQYGVQSLSIDATLMKVARERAEIMAEADYLSHANPDGTDAFDMLDDEGYAYSVTASENIHHNFGYSASQGWQVAMIGFLNSPTHRQALLSPAHNRIGVGIARADSGTRYYAVLFSD